MMTSQEAEERFQEFWAKHMPGDSSVGDFGPAPEHELLVVAVRRRDGLTVSVPCQEAALELVGQEIIEAAELFHRDHPLETAS